ncbi:hypothetical protein [Bacillus alveayuensis]|jgi:hypothetical protein|uniref:hypothetical protein n=1 Tax=Aeribacillus alveayuensis TaxID=279215 RepID=UPI0005D0F529|nr:hypothetical protein [Bacillus alveayuensis]
MEGITERFFQIENEWNIIHLPEKPSGFGVFIIGDKHHYVDEHSSFWIQHYGRSQLLQLLMLKGYTIFYSNLYGRNWGSPEAVLLAKQLYHLVLKREILNKKIHILAEGMGALVAMELMESMADRIRSVAMLNPCLDLKSQIQHEKENKFFYKRMLKELSAAYQMDPKEVLNYSFPQIENCQSVVPVQIWQKMYGSPYPYRLHSKKYEEWRKQLNSPIKLTFHFPENLHRVHHMIIHFFKEHEKEL